MGNGSRVRFRHRVGETGTVVALRPVWGSSPGKWLVEATVKLDSGGFTYAYEADLEPLIDDATPSSLPVPVTVRKPLHKKGSRTKCRCRRGS